MRDDFWSDEKLHALLKLSVKRWRTGESRTDWTGMPQKKDSYRKLKNYRYGLEYV